MRRASIDTSLDPTYGLVRALRPARLLEVEHAALASHVTSCRLLFELCPCLCPWHRGVLGGGDREDVALSYVYADSGCVAASWLCVL